MITVDRATDDQLVRAVQYVVGQSRAFVAQMEFALGEIGSLRDERAVRVVEALELTLREPAGPGTLHHVERAATELLRALVEGSARG